VRLVAVPGELRERELDVMARPPGAPFTNRQITDVTLPGVIAVRRLCLAIYALKPPGDQVAECLAPGATVQSG
jgi:hypothetical protein